MITVQKKLLENIKKEEVRDLKKNRLKAQIKNLEFSLIYSESIEDSIISATLTMLREELFELEKESSKEFKYDDFFIKCEPQAFGIIAKILREVEWFSCEHKEDHVAIMAMGDAEKVIAKIESTLLLNKYYSAPGYGFKYIINKPNDVKTGGNSRGFDLFRKFSAEIKINW